MFFSTMLNGLQDGGTPGPTDDFWYEPVGTSISGVRVTAITAMKVSACYACVRVLAETMASLPRQIFYRDADGDQIEDLEHPLKSILNRSPNPLQTAFEFWEMMAAFSALYGNSYASIDWDNTGKVTAMWPMRPDCVKVEVMPNRRLRYHYNNPLTKTTEIYLQEDIFRVPGLSLDGYTGLNTILFAQDALGLALATEIFGGKFFSQDATPSVVLEHPNALSPVAMQNLKESWKRNHSGLNNAFSVSILEEGMKVNPIGIANKDSQFLETRRYQISEIARFFRIPLHMINELEKSSFSNIEQQSIEFVKYTVRPHCIRGEQRVNKDLLLDERFYMKHNIDALLRGEMLTRYQGYASGINAGWLTRNEARKREDLNKLPGLDEPLSPLNMGGPSTADNNNQNTDNTGQNTDQNTSQNTEDNTDQKALVALDIMVKEATNRIIATEVAGLMAAFKKGKTLPAAKENAEAYLIDKLKPYIIKTLSPLYGASLSLGVGAKLPESIAAVYLQERFEFFKTFKNLHDMHVNIETLAAATVEENYQHFVLWSKSNEI